MSFDEQDYQYDPIRHGMPWRERIKRLLGPVIALLVLVGKWGFVLLKFSSIFIAFGGYALLFGWKFGAGFVLLILLHETGHYLEAKREGLSPRLPVFVPFLGAYVQYTRGHPWQTVRVAIAGPILGGAAAAVCLAFADHSSEAPDLLSALAYTGFFLNLFNLLPFGIFDGGAVWRSARWLRLGGGQRLALASYALYFGTAAMLLLGMYAAYKTQHRL
ncbi:MAG: site-2 protease family protein [Gaiellaceae bacterium]